MKVYCRCKKEKPLTEFAWLNKSKSKYQGACRQCMAEYHKNSYPKWKLKRDPEDHWERQRIKIM